MIRNSIIWFVLLFCFTIFNCNSSKNTLLRTFKSNQEDLEKSASELVKKFKEIDSIPKYGMSDGTVFLNMAMLKGDSLGLPNTLKVLEEADAIYIRSQKLIAYEILSGDGMYTWSVLYLVYNPNNLDYNLFIDEEIETIKEFKKIKQTSWYRLEVSKNID